MVVGDAAQLTGAAHAHVRMACATANAMALHAAAGLDAALRGNAHKPFRMRYAARNISLGRGDAVIDLVHADDSPRNRIVTGRVAALWKNAVAGLVWRMSSGRMPMLTPRTKRRGLQPAEKTLRSTH
jgi:NADH:ubiquinone reductase (H+-translocating)